VSVQIHSDPEIQGGRPVFKGTRIPVGAIKRYALAAGREATVQEWGHGLTMAMVEAALAYEWPKVREADAYAERIDVSCECGEPLDVTADGEVAGEGACVCGRVWRVSLVVECVS
jgi:uncharacterized protein (DUF433 family)